MPTLVTLGRLELLDAGTEGAALNRRRRKLAVLALLALERRPVARDRLLELFWGGQPEDRARHSLSDAVSNLRRVLGPDGVVARQDGLALAADAPLVVDALALERAAADGAWERVLQLDAGPFLAGFSVAGSPGIDEWVDRERRRLTALVAGACRAGCEELAERGEWARAAEVARRWTEAAPESARAARFLRRAELALSDDVAEATGEAPPEALVERWGEAAAGEPRVVVVAGADEARRAASAGIARVARGHGGERGGATVVAVRAYEIERRAPHRLLAEVARTLLDAPGAAGADPAHLAALAGVVPELAERAGPADGCAVHEALRGVLESVAWESPLLLRVDDAHLADDASLDALAHAIGAATGAIALVLSAPADAVADGRAMARVAAGPRASVVTVGSPPAPADEAAATRAAGGQGWRDHLRAPGLLVAVAASVLLMVVAIAAATREAPVLAVGSIVDRSGGDSAGTAQVLPELLATSLARVSELRVLSRARLYEGLAASGEAESPAAVAASARAVGATEILEGTLYRRRGRLRLELRQVALASGLVRRGLTIEAHDAFELADSVTAAFARAHRSARPAPLREVTSTSLAARRLYDEGLRRYHAGDAEPAAMLFDAALREDPGHAMAAHYVALVHGGFDGERVRRALRLAEGATDRERLLVRATWFLELNDPRAAAVAETLAVRYPDEPVGMLLYGRVLESRGDFASAIAWFRRAVERDSLALTRASPTCHACSALGLIKSAALFAGSFRVADDAMSRLADTYRDDRARARLWLEIALVRARDERFADAAAALDSALQRDPSIDPEFVRMQIDVRAGRLADAEARLRARAASNGPGVRADAYLHLGRVLRAAGRHADAVAVARARRALVDTLGGGFTEGALPEAVARLGHSPRLAAALFDSLATVPVVGAEFEARNARNRAWMLTHAATARALAGDTAQLPALADTIRVVGARSGYARDQRLHHYVDGLLREARGDLAGAAASYRRARFSPVETYLGVRLARAELARGAARPAVEVAEAALRGPLDSQNQYESRTELHELLAEAYAQLGDAAAARRHYAAAARAWSRGEGQWRRRGARAAALAK